MFCGVHPFASKNQTEIELKNEISVNSSSLCRTCLSVDRKLLPLGEYGKIFRKIVLELEHDTQSFDNNVQICWECRGLLQKVVIFQVKVKKVNKILRKRQNYPYRSLSTLTQTVTNELDSNTKYIDEDEDEVIKLEMNNVVDEQFNYEDTGDNFVNIVFNQEIHELASCKDEQNETEIKIKSKSKQSRWAIKRKKENSKPKYQVIIKEKDKFRTVKIDFQELQTLRNARDSCAKFKCKVCCLNFDVENEFLKHNTVFHQRNSVEVQNLYICDICSKNFENKLCLKAHLKKHNFKYDCKLCEFSCMNRGKIVKHVGNEHKHVFECLKCGLQFGHNRDFYTHHKENHERYICDLCGVSFKMKYCIEEHIKRQHTKFECKECGKRFARYNGLWLHNKTRHTVSVGQAYCVECDKEYVDIYRYRWHLANSVKHKLKPLKKNRYPCQDCDKVFTKRIYMKDHYNFVHLKHFKYHCDICDKNFVRNPDLVKHRKRVHEGILPPKNKICYICGRGFSTNKILVNHIRTHTGERPFACDRCPATFTQLSALTAHRRAVQCTPH